MAERKRGTPGARVREAINGALGAIGFNRGEVRGTLRGMLSDWSPSMARAFGVGPTESAAAVPIIDTVVTQETVASIKLTLRDHEVGDFFRSAALANHCLRDPDIFGAINQRVLGLLGCAMSVIAADDSPGAVAMADLVRERFGSVVSRAAACDIVTSAVLLGFGVGQIVERWDDVLGELVPELQAWPSHAVSFNESERQWWAYTTTGRVPINPGDGQWVLYTPRSTRRPYYYGALRCIAEWFLRAQFAAGDASKHAEVHGIPVWLAELPDSQRETPNAAAFIRSIKNMGRNAVVPLPQGATKDQSYNLRLEQASTDAYRIFEFLMRTAGGKFRLAILGQDLTSQNHSVGTNASSETGREVSAEIREADAVTFAECLREQLFKPWAAYRSKVEHAPLVSFDTDTLHDAAESATAIKAMGEAAKLWVVDLGLGEEVDVAELARRARVPLIPKKAAKGARGFRSLASGDDDPGFIAGQSAADRVTARAQRALARGYDPVLDALTEAVNAAESPEDLRARLVVLVETGDTAKLEVVLSRARTLARKVGRWSVVGEQS